MTFSAELEVAGKKYDVIACSFDLLQEVDPFGAPAQITRGGRIKLTVKSDGETDLFEWMCDNTLKKNGNIIFKDPQNNDKTLKQLEFTDGFIMKYEEKFDAIDSSPMSTCFTISAREIKMGNGIHVNKWPSNA